MSLRSFVGGLGPGSLGRFTSSPVFRNTTALVCPKVLRGGGGRNEELAQEKV